ncbi:MAG TPA: M48 family metallopeptidase [Candidatus Aquilonibacter sp.]|nr:M48 family metallopeptidase [Candidatus Aquilonibacter sp.]
MEVDPHKSASLVLVLVVCCLWTLPVLSQEDPGLTEVPDKFDLDQRTAAKLRPQLFSLSKPASGQYELGRLVFERLLARAEPPKNLKLSWELRIVNDGSLNAFASPDGTIYVDRGLAELAGPGAGLWAALLSHEIAHVVRRDWARRYLYQKSLENSATVVLGDPAVPADWTDSQTASAALAQFCRQMELDADLAALMLMARAGYHPDFAAALHHLLHVRSADAAASTSLYAMHPCWEQRDHELQRAYLAASIEFDHLWPEWYASPGGNPPVVVFQEYPRIKKETSTHWEIQIPIRCQNLAGAVEVVLRARAVSGDHSTANLADNTESAGPGQEIRQLTGCTSPVTTVAFPLDTLSSRKRRIQPWTDAYVLDAWGTVLSRTEIPRSTR